MEDWDQETLEKAIAEKHAADNKNRATDIVCRFFLDAVEKKQYGWFWTCPNGESCGWWGDSQCLPDILPPLLSCRNNCGAPEHFVVWCLFGSRQGLQVPPRAAARLRAQEPDEAAPRGGGRQRERRPPTRAHASAC
jgi:hypothetical protein